jgi:hypothetical protein
VFSLAALPSLEIVSLGYLKPETEDQRVLANLEPFTALLLKSALRFVRFEDFSFTNALCHATANALEVGSLVTDITFNSDCSFGESYNRTL